MQQMKKKQQNEKTTYGKEKNANHMFHKELIYTRNSYNSIPKKERKIERKHNLILKWAKDLERYFLK